MESLNLKATPREKFIKILELWINIMAKDRKLCGDYSLQVNRIFNFKGLQRKQMG